MMVTPYEALKNLVESLDVEQREWDESQRILSDPSTTIEARRVTVQAAWKSADARKIAMMKAREVLSIPGTGIRVYVAGPYTANPGSCTDTAIAVGDELLVKGFVPFVPHLNHFWDARYHHDWDIWMEFCKSWVMACHILLRLPGESKGADQEVAWAIKAGIPVAYSIEEVQQIAANLSQHI